MCQLGNFLPSILDGLNSNKDHISSIQSIIAMIALIIGGAWVLLHFDLPSELLPEVNLQQTVTSYPVMDDATVLQVDVTLTNHSKKSEMFYCGQTVICQFSPISDDNQKTVHDSLGPNVAYDMHPPIMKAFHFEIDLLVPAGGSATWRRYYSVSPFMSFYVPITLDNTKRIESIGVSNNFYDEKNCYQKLNLHQDLKRIGIYSIFDMKSNKTQSTTEQLVNNSSSPAEPLSQGVRKRAA